MKLWHCPNDHGAVRAPSRMARDDVRRYCLPCSEATGRLVERVCPALERKRTAARLRSAEKSVAARRRARAKWTHDGTPDGTDLRTELRRLVRIAGRLRGRSLRVPELTVHRRRHENRTTGCASGRKVHLTLPLRCSRGRAFAVLNHEVAHWAGHWDHGPKFRAFEVELARAAYRVDGDASLSDPAWKTVRLIGEMIDATELAAEDGTPLWENRLTGG